MSLLDASLREQAAAVAGGEADRAELLAAALSRILVGHTEELADVTP